jgi:hypothetical protein
VRSFQGMASAPKPLVTPDDQLIIVPAGKPKGWRVYSVQPEPSEDVMLGVSRALETRGFKHDWWIQGRGVFLIDCRADLDSRVVGVIEKAFSLAHANDEA